MAHFEKIRYPIPTRLVLQLALDALLGKQRSFCKDAVELVSGIVPPVKVEGLENIPYGQDFIITTNHYTRPGFQVWWRVLVLSAVLEREIIWIIIWTLYY